MNVIVLLHLLQFNLGCEMEVLEDYEEKGSDKPIVGHSCHIYRDGNDYSTILTQFIFEGFRNNKCCILIVDDETKQEILVNLKKLMDVQKYLDGDKIIFVSYKMAFYQENKFSINKIINLLETRLNIAISQDFKGISVCGEMTWIVEDHDALEKLSDLDTALNDFCLMNNSYFLDQMDKRILDVDTIFNLLNLHSSVIIGLQYYKKHDVNYQDLASFPNIEKVSTSVKQDQKIGPAFVQNSILSNSEESYSSTDEQSEEYLKDINEDLYGILDEEFKHFDYDSLWNIFALSSIPTLILAKDGKIVNYNDAMEDLTGLRYEEVPNIIEWFSKVYPNEDYRNKVMKISQKSRECNVPIQKNIFNITRKNGEIRNIEFSVYDIPHFSGPLYLQVVQGIDITQKQFNEEKIRLQINLLEDLRNTQRKISDELRKQTHSLGERVKELNCLYSLSELKFDNKQSIESFFFNVLKLIPPAFQYPEITSSRIIYNEKIYNTDNFSETVWRLNSKIFLSGKMVGIFEVYYSEEAMFLKEEQDLINFIAMELGEFIVRKNAKSTLQWEIETNKVMVELSEALLSPISLDEISDIVLKHAKNLTKSQYGYVSYIDPETGYSIGVTLTRDIWDECEISEKKAIFKKFNGLWGWVLKNKKPIVSNNSSADSRSVGTPEGHIPIRNFLSCPALIEGKLVGQIALANCATQYSDDDLVVIERLSKLYAIAIQRHQMEETIRKERDLAKRYLDISGMIIVGLDTQGDISLINKAGKKVLEVNDEDIIGKNWFKNFLPVENRSSVKQVFYKLMAGTIEPVEFYEDPILTSNGEKKIISWQNTVVNDESGKIIGTFSSGMDITERIRSEKALRKATRKNEFLLDNLQEGVILEDSFGYITYVNPKGAKMLGFTQDKLIGKHWRVLVCDEDLAIVEEESFKRISGISSSYETNLRMKDNKKIPVIVTAAPIFEENESFTGVLSAFTDVSILKSAQKERSKFITMTSHELRTPLTSIKGYFEFLHKYWKNLEEKNIDSSLETIFKNISRLERLISGVININMIERENFIMNMSDFYLCELMDDIQDFYNIQFNESIKFKRNKLEMDTIVYGDQDRLQGVLDNLLDNAIRHTGEETRKINVVSEILPDLIRIKISDNGAGIDSKNMDRIFEQFVSIPTKYTITGTGIGLFISRKTIEAHEGSLAAKSEGVNRGATFVIELPRRHHPSNL